MKRNVLLVVLMALAWVPVARAEVEVEVGSAARADPDLTLGAVATMPEIFGGYVSVWPLSTLSIDGRVTLSTVDAGLTGHLPLAGSGTHRHDLVLTALGGFVHGGVASQWLPFRGARVEGLVGYGFLSSWDFRIQAGITAQQVARGAWGTAFAGQILVGKVF